ncbi:MAG: ribosome small subunit-dependent GTPase A [Chitinophagales bacterium]|nr:ribosome small subunit-dependent GTPase A [Chitinophagales bacterium]
MIEFNEEGVVTKSTGSWYTVALQNGKKLQARLRGNLRLDERDTTNPVAVGDRVIIAENEGDYVISEILPRKNYIVRQSPKHPKARHIIASNIDQAILIATITMPRTSPGFIDRFLLTAEAYHIPVILVFNKNDLITGDHDKHLRDTYFQIYSPIGYKILFTSVKTGENINTLKALLKDKTSLLGGHSGVGKSSLINFIEPSLQLKTQPVSSYTGKGLHTTTFAEMHFLSFGGCIIDTPGIKEFGVSGFLPEEVSHYFIEMLPYLPKCKFNNCLHDNEPDCAVKEAVNQGKIHSQRYSSYLTLLEEVKQARKDWE